MKSFLKSFKGKGDQAELVGIISGVENCGKKSVEAWLSKSKLLSELDNTVNFEVIQHDTEFDSDKYSLLIFVVDLEKPESNILCNQWFHKVRAKLSPDYPCLILANKKDVLADSVSDEDIVEDVKGWLNVQDAGTDPKSHTVIKPISAKRLLENVRFKQDDYEEVFKFIRKCLKTHSQVAHSTKAK